MGSAQKRPIPPRPSVGASATQKRVPSPFLLPTPPRPAGNLHKNIFWSGVYGEGEGGGLFFISSREKGLVVVGASSSSSFWMSAADKTREREREREPLNPLFGRPPIDMQIPGERGNRKKGIERTTRNPSIRVHVFRKCALFLDACGCTLKTYVVNFWKVFFVLFVPYLSLTPSLHNSRKLAT